MFTKVSVLIPTRGRVERLQTLLASFDATTRGDNAELVFRVDDDDPATVDFLSDARFHVSVGPRMHGYASTPMFFNELAALATGDVFISGNDDMVFRTLDWAGAILAEANKYPDGIFDIGVKTHNEANFPFATVSKPVVERVGFFFNPKLFWGDIFWRDVMAHFGRAIPLPLVEIEHDWAGFRPDQVFNEGEKVRRLGHMELHGAEVRAAIDRLSSMMVTA